MFFPANPFTYSAGHFWGHVHCRPYMRARFGLVDALLDVRTVDAVEECHDHVSRTRVDGHRNDWNAAQNLVKPLRHNHPSTDLWGAC